MTLKLINQTTTYRNMSNTHAGGGGFSTRRLAPTGTCQKLKKQNKQMCIKSYYNNILFYKIMPILGLLKDKD